MNRRRSAFIAVTTDWGSIAMTFPRRSTDEQARVEPMPAILPQNAFYLFPWMVILLTRLRTPDILASMPHFECGAFVPGPPYRAA